MKLIGTPTSPYVRKTRVVLCEKKVDYEFVLGLPQADDNIVAQYNPLGKIPVLVLDDDSTLYDSRVITEYLDTVTPNNRLIPASGRERITVKRWEALGDGLIDATVAILHESRRPAGEINAATIERQRGKISAALKAMSEDLGEQSWCHGNAFSLADIAVGGALGYLTFRNPEIDWRSEYPNLAQLFDKLMQRPSFIETAPNN